MATENRFKMSQERLDALKEELLYLETDRAKEVAEQIKEARSFGDLSENSEYDEAKTEQGKLYSRIAELKSLIENAEIVEKVDTGMRKGAVTLGSRVRVRDIEDGNRYNSANVKAFLLKKGEAIEVYATTLHFCPLQVADSGFGCVVGLLEGTNTPLDTESDNKLIFRKNKWLIAHEDNKALTDRGAVAGIYGENYKICGGEI